MSGQIKKSAIVTGGGSGMGRGVAIELARQGTTLAIWDVNGAAAESVVAAIQANGGQATAYPVDVSNSDQVEEVARQFAQEVGDVQILVNCAGRSTHASIVDITEEIFDREIAVNLKGTFSCIRAVVPGMVRARWGRIVNIASLAGQAGVARLTAYSAAKAGVIGLTQAVARELAADGITCNCVAPGAIDTPMLRGAFSHGNLTVEFSKAQAPMGRLGTVEEIVAACAYFISEGAAFVTGQTVGVNGGAYV